MKEKSKKETKQRGRGGARQGSGRKPITEKRKVYRVAVELTEQEFKDWNEYKKAFETSNTGLMKLILNPGTQISINA